MSSLLKRKNIYWVDFRFKGQRIRKSLGTSDLKLAKKIHTILQAQIVQGIYKIDQNQETNRTLKEFSKEYINNHSKIEKSSATVIIDQKALDELIDFLKPFKIIRLITETQVLEFRTHLISKFQPTTVNIKLRALKTAFNWAIGGDRKYVGKNPFSNVSQLRVDNKPILYFDSDQLRKLFTTIHADGERGLLFERYAKFLLFTGCRRNEALNLKWSDIDLKNRWILFAKTKTKDYRRYPINDELFMLVNEIRESNSHLHANDKLFNYIPEDASRKLRRYIRLAELPEYFHLHCLRHTNAILHRQIGTHTLDIKDLLGHSNITTTEIYTKAAPELLRPVVDKLQFGSLLSSTAQENNVTTV
jgi:integrase